MSCAVLDLFCCAGGAGHGYQRAGFDVLGVDIVDRPNYPGSFVRADAIEYLRHLNDTRTIQHYTFIHASPPCQEGCALTKGTNQSRGWGRTHEQLIPALRVELERSGLPYIIEQPIGTAPIRKDITLCGEMFGLDVIRHRNFELGRWTTPQPRHVKHRGRVRGYRHGEWFDGPYVAAYGNGGGKATVKEMQAAMQIDWTDVREELTEAIPPAYTDYLGHSFLSYFRIQAVA